ncbi:hypothetical protein K2X33_09275 [bacterium]|nr:hypothetical protein [bacterium]
MRFIPKAFILLLVTVFSQGARAAGPSDATAVVHVGPAFMVAGAAVGPGVGIAIARRIAQRAPVYLGLDSGMFFQASPDLSIIVPALPMVYYRFGVNNQLTPILGLGLGPVLSIGASVKFLDFMMLLTPGFQFNLDNEMDLFFRISFGVRGSVVMFMPQLGATFRL